MAALNSRQGGGLDRKGKNPKVGIQLRTADKRRRMRDVVFAEMFVSKYHRCVAEGRAAGGSSSYRLTISLSPVTLSSGALVVSPGNIDPFFRAGKQLLNLAVF